jgi:hypothetical protein
MLLYPLFFWGVGGLQGQCINRKSCPMGGCGRPVAGVYRYGRSVNKRVLFSIEKKFAQTTNQLLKAAKDKGRAALEALKRIKTRDGGGDDNSGCSCPFQPFGPWTHPNAIPGCSVPINAVQHFSHVVSACTPPTHTHTHTYPSHSPTSYEGCLK